MVFKLITATAIITITHERFLINNNLNLAFDLIQLILCPFSPDLLIHNPLISGKCCLSK